MINTIKSTAYINGNIITMNQNEDIAEAVMIIGDQIFAVGSNEEIQSCVMKDTEIVDLNKKTVIPGLIDGHVHMECAMTNYMLGGRAFTPPCTCIQDILDVIKSQAEKTPEGEWVVVRGTMAYQTKIKEGRHLTKEDIDAVVNTHPVAFFPAVHTCILNSKGIEKMGWTHEKYLPVNGTMGRDPVTGEPTGIFCETMETAPMTPWPYEDRKKAMRDGTKEFFTSKGVTSIVEMAQTIEGIQAWQELYKAGEAPLRVKLFFTDIYLLSNTKEFLKFGLEKGLGNDWVNLGGIKFFADGTMIHANGYPVKCLHYEQEDMDELVYQAHKAGWQVWTHAMSEDGFEETLIAYERALKRHPVKDHRMRIEHSGEKIGSYKRSDEYVKRMRSAGIGVMTTPVFIYAAEYMDPNSKFHTRGLLDRGFTLPGNSDNTGANPAAFNPWFSMWCAVTRKNYKGEVIQPSECLTPLEALKMFTIWAAWGSFQDDVKGSIEPGKLADLVILGDNPLTCDVDAIQDMPVETVIIGGEVKFKS